jgi:AcrR family transcriptional regulator
MASRRSPPQQKRSKETFERIVEAALSMLDGRNFDDIPIAEICLAADVSSSSFYARFPTKDALLATMRERRTIAVGARMHEIMVGTKWDELPLRDAVHRLIQIYLDFVRSGEPFLRSLRQAELRHPELAAERVRLEALVAKLITEYLSRRLGGDEIVLDRIALAIEVINASISHAVCLPHRFLDRLPLTDEVLVDELTTMFLLYVHRR